MIATLALARFRLRPVPWGWLAVLAAGWCLLTELLAAVPRDPQVGVVVVRWAALLLGLGGVVLAAPETDPPREVLRAVPVPWWRTLALRLAGWLALGALAVLTLAVRLAGTAGWTAADLIRGALPNFLLVTAAGFLAANLTSALVAARPPWPPWSGWIRPGGRGRHGSLFSSAASPGARTGRPAGSRWSGSA
jgi:hypothetical protein